jgi:transposase
VIDVFVDELDLADLRFDGVDPKVTGRPSYHPSVLLKLYIQGYLNRVQSSRRLEREAGRNNVFAQPGASSPYRLPWAIIAMCAMPR